MSAPVSPRDGYVSSPRQLLADGVGEALRSERLRQKLTQRQLAGRLDLRPGLIKRLENAHAGTTELDVLFRVCVGLGLEVKLAVPAAAIGTDPRLLSELNLSDATRAAIEQAGLGDEIAALGPVRDVLQLPAFRGGSEVFEIACALNRHGLAHNGRKVIPSATDRAMLRLRLIERLTLEQIGAQLGLSGSRVRERLNNRFGMEGQPPAPAPAEADGGAG